MKTALLVSFFIDLSGAAKLFCFLALSLTCPGQMFRVKKLAARQHVSSHGLGLILCPLCRARLLGSWAANSGLYSILWPAVWRGDLSRRDFFDQRAFNKFVPGPEGQEGQEGQVLLG